MSGGRSLLRCGTERTGRDESEERLWCKSASRSSHTQPPVACPALSRPLRSRVRLSSKMGPDCTPLSFRKRFSVWSDVLQEQQLTESLQAQVTLRTIPKNVVKQERDVEDYLHDVPSGKIRPSRMERRVKPGSKKTTRKDKKWKTENAVKKETPAKSAGAPSKSKKRKMKKQARKCSPSIDIAFKLKEPRIDLIQKVVETLGEAMAMRLLNETLDVETAGGLMTCNASRRRSPGGVFFHLVKSDKNVTPEQSRAIFGDEVFKRKKVSKNQKKSLDKISVGLDSFSMTGDEPVVAPESVPSDVPHATATELQNADE